MRLSVRECVPNMGGRLRGNSGERSAARGVGVVSGMARGIDAAGHQGALDVAGISCAVLGCGVDVCYPKSSRALYEEILERGSGRLGVSARHAADSGIFSAAQPHHIRACPGGCCGGGKAAERIADHGGFCAGAGEGCLCHSGAGLQMPCRRDATA